MGRGFTQVSLDCKQITNAGYTVCRLLQDKNQLLKTTSSNEPGGRALMRLANWLKSDAKLIQTVYLLGLFALSIISSIFTRQNSLAYSYSLVFENRFLKANTWYMKNNSEC
jgi:hypothetical protein